MPVRSKSNTPDGPRPNIVLLEQYDALAAAISSALKKFAPQHARFIARTVAELETLAADLDPELFIFDVDPPSAGITHCLDRLRDSHPEARALVVGTAIPAAITPDLLSLGGVRFVEKPFELAAFGAAVQALLGPGRESEFRGSLRAFSTIDLILLHCAAGANVTVEVQSRSRTGEIYISGGQLSHAACGKLKGEDALVEILGWSKVRLSESRLSGSHPRTLGPNWPAIIAELLQEARPETSEPPQPEPGPAKIAEPRTGKKVLVIDDTETLLIFVEDVLSTAEPDLQITTALNASAGLREIVRIDPDLVLLDYSLPDFNGDEVCRRLLENEETAGLPVLMMSGHVAEMNATAERFANVVATIEKPFLSQALIDLVRRTLAGEKTVRKKVAARPVPPQPVVQPAPAPVEVIRPTPTPPPEPPSPPPPAIAPPPPPPPRQEPVPPPPIVRQPAAIPIEPRIEVRRPAETTTPLIRVAPTDGSGAVLGLFLEVISMQLTSQLQMGAIRARPASFMASLRLQSATARNAIPAQTGFQIGPAEFSGEGRISALRLLPTTKPLQPAQMRSAFEIGGVAVIPNDTRARVQLTPSGTTPMTMELLAYLELTAVELTPNFQVAQLLLNWPSNAVRVTLNPKAPEQSAAQFQMRVEKLDSSGRIAELLLSPIR